MSKHCSAIRHNLLRQFTGGVSSAGPLPCSNPFLSGHVWDIASADGGKPHERRLRCLTPLLHYSLCLEHHFARYVFVPSTRFFRLLQGCNVHPVTHGSQVATLQCVRNIPCVESSGLTVRQFRLYLIPTLSSAD